MRTTNITINTFCGYGFYIQGEEAVEYYLEFFDKHEICNFVAGNNPFIHYLASDKLFIGFKIMNSLTFDSTVGQLKNAKDDFNASWFENFGSEPMPKYIPCYFQYFIYSK